LPIVIDNIPC